MGYINDKMDIDNIYLPKLDNINFKPIFIMGVHRSGTTILYKLLSNTDCFNIVTTYHIFRYNEILYNHIKNLEKKSKENLNESFKNKSIHARKIDKLKITSDFPEEYGFVLSKKNGPNKITPETFKTFITLCKKIQFISKNNKPILLKNPFDFTNFLYIKSILPKSKFIFIHRNPFKTLNSQLTARRTLFQQKSEYMSLLSPSYQKIFENIIFLCFIRFINSPNNQIRTIQTINKLTRETNYFLKNIKLLNKTDFICIRYEDLCEKPNTKIIEILKFLKIKEKKLLQFSDFIKPRKKTILKELQQKEKYISKQMKPYFSEFKYFL